MTDFCVWLRKIADQFSQVSKTVGEAEKLFNNDAIEAQLDIMLNWTRQQLKTNSKQH